MAEGKWHTICSIVKRKKIFNPEQLQNRGLKRCLNYVDLTALGVGSTLGIGIYVLVGTVAQKIAGPSVLLSFLIAAFTALLAVLCYAEMGARVPLAGTAYIYTYVTVGEMAAFIVGWSNILEFVFGSASVARGLSTFIDTLTNHSMSNWYQEVVPISAPLLSSHFDLFSFLFVLAVGLLLALGVRESSVVNNAFTAINIFIILFAIIFGAFKADTSNWSIPMELVPSGRGEGGFFPYGVWGTLKGAVVCFYGFVGFDIVNAGGEEVKNPQRAIPTALLSVLLVVFASYAALSIVVTMMVPYYELSSIVAIPMAFSYVGWEWARWIIAVGAIFGLSACLLGAIFPLPRLLYSMASDGLFIRCFARLSKGNKSPVIATVISAIIIATLSAILDLEQLVLMMCIGTLCTYTIVAACVVLLRYSSNNMPEVNMNIMKHMIGCGDRKPTRRTKQIINIAMVLYVFLCIAIAIVFIHTYRPLAAIIILHILAIFVVLVMALQPTSDEKLSFKTPLVPFLPCLSIYANIHLLVIINWHTWITVLIWMVIGIPIYLICICCYKQNSESIESDNQIFITNLSKNGKPVTVEIVVEAPTPPGTMNQLDDNDNQLNKNIMLHETIGKITDTKKSEQVMTQQMLIENNEEKEAKIIDLLDQVLQAEEDSYGEIVSLKENKEENQVIDDDEDEVGIPHRKSLSELSDAGSDASFSNQGLSKYDVIAQVHREDLPKVSEEDEKGNNLEDFDNEEDQEITAFNESETNSRTDESGYSDTIDRPTLSESLEDNNISNIPEPPPFDESYFNTTPIILKFYKHKTSPKQSNENLDNIKETATLSKSSEDIDVSTIPVPPPFDENYFKDTPIVLNLKKYRTVSPRHSTVDIDVEDEDINEPRISLRSNNSKGEGNMRFGSARQIKFMSTLNDIFQKTINNEDEEPRKRSQSTGNVAEAEMAVQNIERPQFFLDLKKELLSRESLPNLRQAKTDNEPKPVDSDSVQSEEEDTSMSRVDLKNKLEHIFAVGGPQLLAKPRLMKSNPPTPEESYQTDPSSTESIPKLQKMEKNDTLKRQKEKFGHVLNSIRLSLNQNDEV